MKTEAMKKHLKKIATLLCFILLIQNCTVYKSANVSLYEASQSNAKVKITNSNGEKLKFYRVEQSEDGKFLGNKRVRVLKGKNIYKSSLINTKAIEKVQIQDKLSSTLVNVPLIAGGAVVGLSGAGLLILGLNGYL
ncbi:hypothetical protein [Aestuariivivens sediminicola]|uniref:hypothetical protein n=1 Tax=Aestuariivivens sediminicola TaxID=2913560 RepID=UPI001F5A8536|nr:hypothetical protein [Aestuariivivens sediminicola]